MTTSFSLLMHGDIWNSLRANFVGTVMAAVAVAMILWSVAAAAAGRLLGIRSIEHVLTWLVALFIALLIARWLVVLVLSWAYGIEPY
jgi:hypothetical protein